MIVFVQPIEGTDSNNFRFITWSWSYTATATTSSASTSASASASDSSTVHSVEFASIGTNSNPSRAGVGGGASHADFVERAKSIKELMQFLGINANYSTNFGANIETRGPRTQANFKRAMKESFSAVSKYFNESEPMQAVHKWLLEHSPPHRSQPRRPPPPTPTMSSLLRKPQHARKRNHRQKTAIATPMTWCLMIVFPPLPYDFFHASRSSKSRLAS